MVAVAPLFGIGVGTNTTAGAGVVYNRACGSGSPIQCHEARVQLDTSNAGFRFGANRQHYNFFNVSFPDSMMANDATNNRLSLVSHKVQSSGGATWAQVATGSIDANIIARGNEIKTWQDAHRGVGKWGATFPWAFHHEPNDETGQGATQADMATNWRAAAAHILDLWYNTCGVVRWDGDANFATRTEGIIPSINMVSGIASNHDTDISTWWGNDAWMDANITMLAGDPYNFGTNCRTFENIDSDNRAWGITKRSQQAAAGRTFMTAVWETGTEEAGEYSANDASWTATGLARTKANWWINASAYLKSGASLLSLWTYYDDAPGHPNQPDSTQASWDEWLNSFCTTDFLTATDALPASASTPMLMLID